MQRAEAHIYFLDTIGCGDWFYGTTFNDVRYCVEGYDVIFGGSPATSKLPAKVVLHFPACNGGDVVEGYAIYNYLRGLANQGVVIEARVEGLCASIAVLVALAADTVLMADAAFWMVHKPSGGVLGDADLMRSYAELLDKIQAQLVDRYVARTGGKLTAETAHALINKESWLNADECLACGFITGKLPDAPIAVPTGAEGVLNYFPTTKPTAPAMAISPAEKKSIVDDVINGIKGFFKNDAPAPVVPPVATNATAEVTGGDPLYYDGTELSAGTAVYSDEALTTAYPDGDYALADGREVTVLAGAVDTLTAADATNAAANATAANAAELEALRGENAALKAENALQARKVTGLTNKFAKAVPGGGANPTPPGAGQTIANKTGGSPAEKPIFTITRS